MCQEKIPPQQIDFFSFFWFQRETITAFSVQNDERFRTPPGFRNLEHAL